VINLQTLMERHGIPHVDETSVEALLDQSSGLAGYVLLFFPGDMSQRAESSDVAVILPQLLAAFSGQIRGAVVAAEAEEKLKPRFRVLVAPSLVLIKQGQTVDIFTKVLDWSDYVSRINAALNPSDMVSVIQLGPSIGEAK
jgi:hydrogenase-1 operon protein HyaE